MMMRPEDASYAEIWINALLKFIKHIDNCIPNFINLIALPWNGEQYLSSFSSGRTGGNVQPDVPPDDSERSNLFGSPAETGRETPRFVSSPPSHGSAPCETFGEMFGPTDWHGLSGAVSRWNP
jgi:hypothetical protein